MSNFAGARPTPGLRFLSQFWPLLIGAGVAATLVGGRFAYTAVQRIALNRAAVGGVEALSKKFYDGGFEGTMTRREAALVLGCRCVRGGGGGQVTRYYYLFIYLHYYYFLNL